MLKKLDQSSGNVLGYRVIGTITRDDYAVLKEEVDAVILQESSIRMLLDLEEFKGEEMKAWGADLKFGHDYRKKITRMAIVGDKKWQEWIAAIADPFYAQEAEFFTLDEREDAWEWLRT